MKKIEELNAKKELLQKDRIKIFDSLAYNFFGVGRNELNDIDKELDKIEMEIYRLTRLGDDLRILMNTYPVDTVNHPPHYQGKTYEVIDIIDDFDLSFCLGNAIKYILRAGKKNDRKEDLQKAIWYIQREIENG